MIEVRCKNCNKLFGKFIMMIGAVKCSRCKMIIEYKIITNTLHITDSYDSLKPETKCPLPHNAAVSVEDQVQT